MAEKSTVVLGRFLLTLNKDCYLVEVRENKATPVDADVSDLPDWIFDSKHTIWLMEENKPIADRARDGELVREILQRSWMQLQTAH